MMLEQMTLREICIVTPARFFTNERLPRRFLDEYQKSVQRSLFDRARAATVDYVHHND